MKKNKESTREVQNNINCGPDMEKNEELQNAVHFAISRKPIFLSTSGGVYARVGKYMKIFSYLILLSAIGLVFTSCLGGYMATEPAYVDYARPQRQYDNQIWIDGDWGWNNQTHIYVQKAGYWAQPRQGRSYVAGNWNTTARGKSWTKGHWQKDAQQNNRQNNSRQNNTGNR
jgi:hypothetical protein